MLPLAAVLALAYGGSSDDWQVEDHETINRTFQVGSGAGARRLLVDNMNGFIHVTANGGSQVRVSVERHTTAESKAALADAKRDVKLEMSQQGNEVRLYVDSPSRHNDHGDRYDKYRVRLDYEIEVPREIELVLKNMNHEIQVNGTSGNFEVHGMNGGIDMEGVAGSGFVNTLNGKIRVAFARNPDHDTSFHTLNGKVDIYFQEPLNADLRFHTLNGGVWADFDVAPDPSSVSGQNGHLIYSSARSNRNGSGRVGSGGPVLTLNSLNGAIRLHTKTQ
jgi:hypothetical protein